MQKQDKILVAGCQGLVGSAITSALRRAGYENLLLPQYPGLDFRIQQDVNNYFSKEKPDYIFLAAAKVGGIYANNTYRGEFIYDNLAIATNIIEAARHHNAKRLLFLGSSCIYPRDCPQPMKEEYLLTSPLEKTNEPYAIAKIAGIKLCEAYNFQYGTNFVSVMPTNLYGLNDNFDLQSSHVLPALIRKVHEAKEAGNETVTVWGTGTPKREFLHVDDLAAACLFIMNKDNVRDLINVGSGEEVTIRQLAELIFEVVGFKGSIAFDTSKPDGTLRKLLDSSKLRQLGWSPKVSLREGITALYEAYKTTNPSK